MDLLRRIDKKFRAMPKLERIEILSGIAKGQGVFSKFLRNIPEFTKRFTRKRC